ncbi:hypothetical protein LIER_33985 [Lithospermum erythrorhizon]|uniref:Uncharacterized protein n=1 Tax=Lithospermum erythrorhizon TaxID=34254 RepID=A0AAV3RZQ2_LITER
MTFGVEGLEEQLHLLKKEVFKISKKVTRIGEKLKVDMGLNSDEEDEASEDIEEEDDESIHDVLGSDENSSPPKKGGNLFLLFQTKNPKCLDVPESDKEVSKDDTELSEGHSEELVKKGKGPVATSEDRAKDDSDDVLLAQKKKELRRNPAADAPQKAFILMVSWKGLSRA